MSELVKWLNLCRKAGKVAIGDAAVRAALNSGKAHLTLLASDAAPGTMKWVYTLTRRHGVRLLDTGQDKETLGMALGRGNTAVAAITNKELAGAILLNSSDKERA